MWYLQTNVQKHENTLLSQKFVKDNKKSITQVLDEVEKGLTVTEFQRVTLG